MAEWVTGWVRPMVDVSASAGSVDDVTLRMRAVAGSTGSRFRVELSNVFGDKPLVIGRVVVTVGGEIVGASFGRTAATSIPAGASGWTDVICLPVRAGQELVIDVHVPRGVRMSTGNFASTPLEISQPGDHAGEHPFPAVPTPTIPAPDGSEMSIPVPFLRAVEIDADAARVVACLGDSITAGGWPEMAAALLSEDTRGPVMLNLGIAGNRLRVDAAAEIASFGRSGLSRFADDVLALAGVTDVVIALGTNDLGLPGQAAPLDELPTAAGLIAAYSQLTDRAAQAGLSVIVATITPFIGADGIDHGRESLRDQVNTWIRSQSPGDVADFDAVLCSTTDPSRLAEAYDSGDHLHPNEAGEQRLAQTIAAALGARR